MSHYALDRFEDNAWAVLERSDGETFNVPKEWLPEDAREGDVLRADTAVEGSASRLLFSVDAEETDKRRDDARKQRERLLKGPEGDIEL